MNGQTERTTRKQSRRWVVPGFLAAVGAIGLAILVIALFSRGPEPPPEGNGPLRGVSCVHLREAADALDAGDSERLNQAITQAAQAAEASLDTSGQLFGRPERLSLELQAAMGKESPDSGVIRRLLGESLSACDLLAE